MKSLSEIFEDERVAYSALNKKEGFDVHNEWLELFANKLKDSKGKFRVGQYIWELYWSGLLPSIDGDEGFNLYQSKPLEDFYVIYENGREVFDCSSTSWPNFSVNEVIVFPKSKSWSMVYSHEETMHYVEPENNM